MASSLPIPAENAQQHSVRLQNLIKQKIAEHRKISFYDLAGGGIESVKTTAISFKSDKGRAGCCNNWLKLF